MKHLGDIKGISGYEAPIVDVITGGSPCQDLSVAGKRAGLAGERSGLFMEQIRIVREMRERDVRENGRAAWAVRPRYMVWENVPGAFSSGNPKGSDFAAVLEEIIKVAEPDACVQVCVPDGGWTKSGCYYSADGKWSVAWRLHDAQFWGVPQRRKRIALVADFGGLSAPEILFERKGLSGDFEPGAEAWEGTPGAVGGGAYPTVARSLTQRYDGSPCVDRGPNIVMQNAEPILLESNQNHATVSQDGVRSTLSASMGMGGGYAPMVCTDHVEDAKATLMDAFQHHGYRQNDTCGTLTKDQNCGIRGDTPLVVQETDPNPEVAVTLDASYYKGAWERNGVERTVVCVGNGQLNQDHLSPLVGALNCMHDQQAIMMAWDGSQTSPTLTSNNAGGNQRMPDKNNFTGVIAAVDFRNGTENSETNGTLQAKENGGQSINYQNTVRCGSFVRRLTPMECERLQGYPDGWTDIGEWTDSKGKKHKEADSPRYKALGNSIALPFWQWLARRICAQYERQVTMASLFDGIGGFPLAFQSCGALPVWASEIEEFPIAVTKIRFPE